MYVYIWRVVCVCGLVCQGQGVGLVFWGSPEGRGCVLVGRGASTIQRVLSTRRIGIKESREEGAFV